MKILELNSLNNGSTGNIMLRIADCARKNGDEVLVCFPKRRQNTKRKIHFSKMFGNSVSTQLHYYAAKLFGFDGRFSFFATIGLLRTIKRFKPNVVHLHNLHGCFINLKLLFGYLKKHKNIKVVWTFHDCWPFTGGCAHFQIANCNEWSQSGCLSCPKKVEYPKGKHDNTFKILGLKKLLFTNLESLTVVTPSKWLASIASETFFKKSRILTINNGINLDCFKKKNSSFREQHNIDENAFVLLGVAFNWNYRKGLDIFIKLANEIPDDIVIVLVGTNDTVDKLLPESIISIHKTSSADEMAELYSSVDLFVNPTREDNFPTVNMEALACGTPVLTFDTGGSSETIEKKVGSVVDKDDFSALVKEIMRIKNERPFSETDCRNRATFFDEKDKALEYVKLFHAL